MPKKFPQILIPVSVILSVILCGPFKAPAADFSQDIAERHLLDNGMVVLINEDSGKQIESLRVTVKAGSASEEEYAGSGIAHFVEHMLFKGTASRPVGSIQDEIKAQGASFNASTSHDFTAYHITSPAENYRKCIGILADALMNSSLDAAEIERERKVILNEINMGEDDPDRYFSKLLWASVYSRHPYRHPVIGHRQLFNKITRDDLLKYYRRKYAPNNIVFAAAGPVEAQEILACVKNAFSDFKMGFPGERALSAEPEQITEKRITEYRDTALARLALAFKTTPLKHQDLFAMDAAAMILGEGRSSRLYRKLKEEERLVYSINSFNYTPEHKGFFAVMCVLEPENIDAAEASILREIEKIKKEKVTPQELEKAKAGVITGHLFGLEPVSGRAMRLSLDEAMCDDVNFSKKYVERVGSVTREDIASVANKYLNASAMTAVRMMPQESRKAGAGRKTGKKDKKITSSTLKSGMRLLLREDDSLPAVSIAACFPGGSRYEDEKTNGISSLTSALLLKGTNKKAAKDIAELVDSMGAELGNFSGNNSFGLTMKIKKDDMDAALELLAEMLTSPSFKEEEIDKHKRLMIAAIESEKDSVFAAGKRLLQETLFKKHPFRFQPAGTVESVGSLNKRKVKEFFKRRVNAQGAVVAVFGDINAADTAEKIKLKFAGLNRRGGKPVNLAPQPRLKKTRRASEKLPKEQALIMLGFLGPSMRDDDRYAASVVNSVLSGEGGRLYDEIREKNALSYAVGSYAVFGIETGYLVLYAATTPQEAQDAEKALLGELETLKAQGVPQKELDAAKEELIGGHKAGLETNSSLSLASALDEMYGLGFDNYLKFQERIRAVTAENVKRFAEKYFDEGYAKITIMPEDKGE